MNQCPSDERLAGLLDERLDAADLAAVEAHLESCARCQQALEDLTYERFSSAEWGAAAGSSCASGAPAPAAVAGPGGLALLDAAGRDEPESRRQRLLMDSSPRQPSSIHFTPNDRIGPRDEPGAGHHLPQVDGYDIVGRLGRGGMGVVYRARQRGLDRLVALKMLRGGVHADAESLARFRIEVRAAARLRHPNVVQVYDVGESQGLPYVALELLEGGNLETRVGGDPQPEADSAALISTLARAIAEAHRAGVVHRDLKPANVLFTRDGTPKVTDFGLAKRLDEDDGATQSGQVMGSPSFMAPEQARGDASAIGPAVDVYSLGATLYEMLTGRPPFKGGSALETLHQVLHAEPVAPSRLRPGLARDLETICLKCLAKSPAQRYASADALAEDLDRFLDGAPILARRVRALERGWKWARREPAAAALVAAAVVAAAAGLWGVKTLYQRAERHHTEDAEALAAAMVAVRDEDWGNDGVVLALNQTLRHLDSEPSTRAQAKAFLDRIRRGREGKAAQAASDAVHREYDRFAGLLRRAEQDDARWLQLVRADGEPRPVRASTAAALEVYGRFAADPAGAPGLWLLTAIPGELDPAARSAVERGCRDLTLLRAEAIGRPAPGEDPREQARRALDLLDGPDSRSAAFLRARLLDQLGEGPAAAAELARARALPAVDGADLEASGRDRLLRSDLPGAVAEYESALRLDPGCARAPLGLAVAQLLSRRPDAARHVLTACLQRDPGSAVLRSLRGLALGEAAGRLLDGDAPARAEAGRLLAAAEDDFAAALGSAGRDGERAALRSTRGLARACGRRWADAEADFAFAAGVAPGDWSARVNWGQALYQLGRPAEAIEQFSRAIALNPTRAEIYSSRALARLRLGAGGTATRAAVADFDEAIRLGKPGSADLAADHARRGRLLLKAGRSTAALSDADAAIRIGTALDEEESTRVAGALDDAAVVRVRALLAQRRHAEVVRACDEALARRPDAAELWELRGIARAEARDYAGSIDDHTRALGLEPGRTSARLLRGWTYALSDAARLALLDFDAAVARDPEGAEGYVGRGFAHALLGEHRAAAVDAEESLRRSAPGDARARYNAARVYAQSATTLASPAAGRRGAPAASLAEGYEERALALLRAAVEALPADQRPAFLREVVQPDPALAALRGRPQFARLADPADPAAAGARREGRPAGPDQGRSRVP